jgi:hypothetical protein
VTAAKNVASSSALDFAPSRLVVMVRPADIALG